MTIATSTKGRRKKQAHSLCQLCSEHYKDLTLRPPKRTASSFYKWENSTERLRNCVRMIQVKTGPISRQMVKGSESEFLTSRKRDGFLGGPQTEIGKEWE